MRKSSLRKDVSYLSFIAEGDFFFFFLSFPCYNLGGMTLKLDINFTQIKEGLEYVHTVGYESPLSNDWEEANSSFVS